MPAERFDFPNAQGQRLAALIDRPAGEPRACALFAHCFTCGKDVHAARRIAEGLSVLGVEVLRFDFTGIGASEGELANTGFASNVADLVAAANELRRRRRAPDLLIGHSLGGAAVLAAAADIPEARAVVTLAAPSDPGHLAPLIRSRVEHDSDGTAQVELAGRRFRISRRFIDDLEEHSLRQRIGALGKALLVLHAPEDEIVGIDNATRIFVAARHPKSFVSLAGADHLLSRREDASYVAGVVAAWSARYLEAPPPRQAPQAAPGTVEVAETRRGRFQQEITVGAHRLLADEPVEMGGMDSGPGPYDLLLAALGACTAMTLRLYAERKGLPLERASVKLRHSKIHAADCADCETREGRIDRIERTLVLEGPLDADTRRRLLEIADKCSVHRTLTGEIDIRPAAAENA
jgi:putative redox protein